MYKKLSLKQRLNKGEVIIGIFLKINSPAVAEIIGYSGFDFIIIDNEHSNFSYYETENIIRAANSTGINAIVRVASASEEHILHAADSGSQGVQIPSIVTIKEAKQAAEFMRYYPYGNRGVSFIQRSTKYTFWDKDNYIKYVNDKRKFH